MQIVQVCSKIWSGVLRRDTMLALALPFAIARTRAKQQASTIITRVLRELCKKTANHSNKFTLTQTD